MAVASRQAHRRRRRLPRPLSAGILLLACISAAAGESPLPESSPAPSGPNPEALEAITLTVRGLSQDPVVSTGTVGFWLAPLDKPGEPLLKQFAGQSFIPASTLKTLTTGSALELLGPDFCFETKLYHVPASGDLIIEGSGDPSLGRPSWEDLFNEWTSALRSAGIREIHGRIIADESAWQPDEIPDGWTWQDIGNYYAPVLTPLCFHDNAFRLYFSLSGPPGAPAGFYDANPWPAKLEVVDQLLTGRPGTGDNAYVFGGPGASRYFIRGTFAADAGKNHIRAALPDPALFCARELTGWLNARQIPVHGQPTTTRTAKASGLPDPLPQSGKILVAVHRSRPLQELLIPINHRSLNLDCECLLRTIGKGSPDTGSRAIRKLLASKNLPLEGYHQADGSGLSRTNMITPALLAQANAAFLTGPHGSIYLSSLPELGTTGSTLGKLSVTGPAIIHAKSGTIERVKAYTGVIASAAGPRYCFAILVNNYDGSFSKSVGPWLDELFEAMAAL